MHPWDRAQPVVEQGTGESTSALLRRHHDPIQVAGVGHGMKGGHGDEAAACPIVSAGLVRGPCTVSVDIHDDDVPVRCVQIGLPRCA